MNYQNQIWTPSSVVVAHPTIFSRQDIERFEAEILSNPDANEHTASHFFEQYPKFLYLGNAAELRREVILVGADGDSLQRVDFFKRSYGRQFWDIVELKHPQKNFVRGSSGLHPSYSAEVDRAVNQALDYRHLIQSNEVVRNDLASKGILICAPVITVVVGQTREDIDVQQLELIQDRLRQRGGIQALSYTDIFNFAKEHYQQTATILIPSMHVTTPDVLEQGVNDGRLIQQILTTPRKIREIDPISFERIVSILLPMVGYLPTFSRRLRPKGGGEYLAPSTTNHHVLAVIQCGGYRKSRDQIGVEEFRRLYNRVLELNANKGIYITSGNFKRSAIRYMETHQSEVEGYNGDQIVEWIRTLTAHTSIFL